MPSGVKHSPLMVLTIDLNEEERCAMADIARSGDMNAIHPRLRNHLIVKLATAATKALYGGYVPLSDNALLHPGPGDTMPLDLKLSVTFTPALPVKAALND